MVKDHSDSENRNPLPPRELLFLISSKFIGGIAPNQAIARSEFDVHR